MKPPSLPSGLGILGALVLFVFFTSCVDSGPTEVEQPSFAKGGDKDVTVQATDPDSATQDTTLTVLILGDGFDDGSVAEFQLSGVPTEKVKVKSTQYLGPKKLRTEVEISADADIAVYDVEVTTRRGKKGIGTELFRVVQRTAGPTKAFNLTDFELIEVPHAQAPEGRCPDPDNPCYKLVVHYSGSLHWLAFLTIRVYDEYFDPGIENKRAATGALVRGASDDIVPATPGEVTAYWQGQWKPVYMDGVNPPQEQPAEPLVDFAPEGEAETFAFGFEYVDHFGGYINAGLLNRFPQALAYFRGQAPTGYSYAAIDDVELITIGKGKKAVKKLRFHVHAYSSPTVQDSTTRVFAVHSAMVTYSDGRRSMLTLSGMEGTHGEGDHGTIYTFDLPSQPSAPECYQFRVVAMDSYDGFGEHFDDRFIVWDPERDAAGAAPVGVRYDGETVTTLPGGCGY